MNLNRRDVIKYASAAGFLTALPAPDRAAAMRALEVPVSENPTLDPATFADDTFTTLVTYEDTWYTGIAPHEWHAFKRAQRALEVLVPSMRDHAGHRAIWDAATEVENTLLALVCASHTAGLRQGARFENLRQSLVSDHAECRACWGEGEQNGVPCVTCAGTGVVPFADGRQQR